MKKCISCGKEKRLYLGICPDCRESGKIKKVETSGGGDISNAQVSRTKTWLDIQIEEAVARVLALAKENGNKKFALELEVEINVKEVKVKQ